MKLLVAHFTPCTDIDPLTPDLLHQWCITFEDLIQDGCYPGYIPFNSSFNPDILASSLSLMIEETIWTSGGRLYSVKTGPCSGMWFDSFNAAATTSLIIPTEPRRHRVEFFFEASNSKFLVLECYIDSTEIQQF